MTKRTEQVESLIHHHLGEIFSREVELSDGTLATISSIFVPPDLKKAVVKVSVLPFNKSKKVIKQLQAQRGSIQKELNKKITMKVSPRLEFILDETQQHVSELEKLMDLD